MADKPTTYRATLIYKCGCPGVIETSKPLPERERAAERERRCPRCRLLEPENIFGTGGDIKIGGTP